jgi:hypothetical protein
MRQLVFLALLALAGCDKFARKPETPPAAGVPATENTAPNKGLESPEFARNYELAKARAVRDFPALGVAGSPMNLEFVARAKRMQEAKASELSSPEWPYQLALKVNAEQVKAREAMLRPGTVLSITDLQSMRPPPAGACVTGHITQAYGGKTADITLDNALKCEISDPVHGVGASELEWVRQENLLVLRTKSSGASQGRVLRSFAIGQRITVEGSFAPAGTTKKLIGVIK